MSTTTPTTSTDDLEVTEYLTGAEIEAIEADPVLTVRDVARHRAEQEEP